MMTQAQFVATVERYLTESGMTATAFGRAVSKDPNFVFDLRGGRQTSLTVVNRALEYMAAHPPRSEMARAS